MIVLRRLILALALMFWQGGFMFYGAVVVEVGADVLGSHRVQGFVTRAVTNYLNLAGVVALGVWAWDLAATPGGHRRAARWICWCLLAVFLVVLAFLHTRLDARLDATEFRILDESGYRVFHIWYLGVSTIQWAAAIVLIGLTIQAWRMHDGVARR